MMLLSGTHTSYVKASAIDKVREVLHILRSILTAYKSFQILKITNIYFYYYRYSYNGNFLSYKYYQFIYILRNNAKNLQL